MNLFDSSALLCFLLDEPGADLVEEQLELPGACSAASWSEVAQKSLTRGLHWAATRQLLLSGGLVLEAVTTEDAEVAAALWRRRPSLSLADRLCLATAERLDATVWTADAAWGTSERIRQVR